MKDKYYPPCFKGDGFSCPHCGVWAHQLWYDGLGWRAGATYSINESKENKRLEISICEKCQGYALWVDEKMVYPLFSVAPLPSEDMPKDVKDDFLEARNIVNSSPRAAAALLRLAIQKLMPHLGKTNGKIDDDIADLVKDGMSAVIQKALDTVRVIGNNAVHPGEIDLKDDVETAVALFGLVNMIVDAMITQPKEVEQLFGKLPRGAKEAIQKRDKSE
jgi:hypothetical protein